MSILIVGSEGSMGKRYQAILNYLGKEWHGIDIGSSYEMMEDAYKRASAFIIATPTDTHLSCIYKVRRLGKPILCEKPITKEVSKLKQLFQDLDFAKVPFHMMYQYKNLIPHYVLGEGKSYYNYFRHGNDGLVWDALQIIGLSKNDPVLEEDSPIWKCRINGHFLSLNYMDEAYVTSVIDFIKGVPQDYGEIIAMHEKASELANVV